jgi:hypothetical protein
MQAVALDLKFHSCVGGENVDIGRMIGHRLAEPLFSFFKPGVVVRGIVMK